MAIVDLVMPKLGESIVEATILKWLKQPGDKVQQDETVLEIATDKVDSEVPSTVEGILEEVLFKVNDIVPVGSVIAKLRTEAEEKKETVTTAPQQPVQQPVAQKTYTPQPETVNVPATTGNGHSNGYHTVSNNNRFYSPLVLNIAGSEGVSMTELERMPGSGNEGRGDQERYIAVRYK